MSKLVACGGGDPDDVRTARGRRRRLPRRSRAATSTTSSGSSTRWDKIRLEQEGVDVATIPFIDHTDCIPDWYTPMLATTEKELDQRGEVLERFMRATRRGYQGAMADPAARGRRAHRRRRPRSTPTWSGPAPSTSPPATRRTRPTGAARTARCGRGSPRSSRRPAWSTRTSTSRPPSRTTCCEPPAGSPSPGSAHTLPRTGAGGGRRCGPVGPHGRARDVRQHRRTQRVREEHAAPGAGRRADARRRGTATIDDAGRPRPARARLRTWPRRTCCCRGGGRSTTRSSAASSTARTGPRPGRGRRPRSTGSASPGSSRRGRTSSAAGCDSGSPSSAPSCSDATCCCSTSPSAPWTRSPGRTWSRGWPRCGRPTGGPPCSSPTTWRRRCCCPTGSR